MHKIYSRFRIRMPKLSRKSSCGLPRGSPLVKMIVIMTIAFSTAIFILKAIEPVFRAVCEEKAKSIATIVSNQQATEVMKKYSYDDLFTIERDENGNIRMVQSNIIPMNEIMSDVPNRIQEELNSRGRDNLEIPLRYIYRNSFFCGRRTRDSYSNSFGRKCGNRFKK